MDRAQANLVRRGLRFFLATTAIATVVGGLLFLLIKLAGISLFAIEGPSMEPTIQDGDSIILRKTPEPVRGELIFFHKPESWGSPGLSDADSNRVLVKRVVGLPGDELAYSEGALLVNGEVVADLSSYDCNPAEATYRHTLTSEELFVLGDNAAASLDSRRVFCDGDEPFYVSPERAIAYGHLLAHF